MILVFGGEGVEGEQRLGVFDHTGDATFVLGALLVADGLKGCERCRAFSMARSLQGG